MRESQKCRMRLYPSPFFSFLERKKKNIVQCDHFTIIMIHSFSLLRKHCIVSQPVGYILCERFVAGTCSTLIFRVLRGMVFLRFRALLCCHTRQTETLYHLFFLGLGRMTIKDVRPAKCRCAHQRLVLQFFSGWSFGSIFKSF